MKGSLYHSIPAWVSAGSRYHVRIGSEDARTTRLTDPETATAILGAAQFYHDSRRWFLSIFLIMPDHLHAIFSFPLEPGMSQTIHDWKSWLRRKAGIRFQDNYFDHRLRTEEEYVIKMNYIRMNPVVAELCTISDHWRWKNDPFEKLKDQSCG
jgi:REP element-mobilizing transposase RayT